MLGVRVLPRDRFRISRTPDSRRADSKFHPRLRAFDGAINPFDKRVDVFPPPMSAVESSGHAIFAPAALVWKIDGARRLRVLIGIEIIIELHGIDVVSLHDIHDYFQRIVLHLAFAGVHPKKRLALRRDSFHPARVGSADMVSRYGTEMR